MTELLGEVLAGRFRVEQEMLRVGARSIYRATDLVEDRELAVEIPHASVARSSAEYQVWHRALSMLDHAGVVRIHAIGLSAAGRPYVARDAHPGRSLKDVVENGGPLPAERVASIACDVLSALVHAHRIPVAGGLLHLDVRTASVFLLDAAQSQPAHARLNFGHGGVVADAGAPIGLPLRPTTHGPEFATPVFSSPEQKRSAIAPVNGLAVDDRSDVYSVGAIAFTALTARLHLGEERLDVHTATRAYYDQPMPSVRDVLPSAPRNLASFIDRCLAVDPEDRWPSAVDALEAVESARRPSLVDRLRVGLRRRR
ncbi:MAG: hypothetical protein AAGB93_22260 [Planctomycetota bacterium]